MIYQQILARWRIWLADERGLTMVEYAIAGALIVSALGFFAFFGLGVAVDQQLGNISGVFN